MDERLTQETLSNLVTQFSSAWDYLRELVQNSIDAGSNHIEVWTEFEAGPAERPDDGVISIHVDDFGAGMTEEIIDKQLTQLFSSAKEDDLTKIGKFGIGFVSVFALQPAGVLVHTGRGGEFWEVFFHADLSFTKTRIDNAVEGTQITSFLAGDRSRYAEVVERVESTLRKWCAHSDTEITFEDRSDPAATVRAINEEFTVPGEFTTHATRGELSMVLAYTRQPVYGFYNRGLALAVGSDADEMLGAHADRFRHVGFKVKSPWLEHTLSRETVMRDEHFEQAMATLTAVASEDIRRSLVDGLCARVRQPAWDLDELADYLRWVGYLLREPDSALLDTSLAHQPFLRTVDGRAATLDDAWKSFDDDGHVFVASEPTALTRAMQALERPVFLVSARGGGQSQSPVASLLGRYCRMRDELRWRRRIAKRMGIEELFRRKVLEIADPHEVLCAVETRADPPSAARALVERSEVALRRLGRRFGGMHVGAITSGAGFRPLFVISRKLAPVMSRPIDAQYVRGRWERPHVVVDPTHPHVAELVALAASMPDLAVFCMCRALLLHEEAMAPSDDELTAAVAQALRNHPLVLEGPQ